MRDVDVMEANVTQRVLGNEPLLYLNGHFDFTNIDRFESLLRGRVTRGAVVSFERVAFFDCSVISALVRLQAAAAGKLVIVLSPALPGARIFDVLQAETFLRVAPDLRTAFDLLAGLAAV